MCAHNAEGAMGLVINKVVEQPSIEDLLRQLGIAPDGFAGAQVHFGGPVESGRGFVLHSTDYTEEATLAVSDGKHHRVGTPAARVAKRSILLPADERQHRPSWINYRLDFFYR